MESVQKRWYDDASYEDVRSDDDRLAEEVPIASDEKIYVASYVQLMWWRFLRHRMAVISRGLCCCSISPGFCRVCCAL